MGSIKQITLRLPMSLFNQVKDRSLTNRRHVSTELVHLIETVIDEQTRRDLGLTIQTPGRSQSAPR